VEEPCQSAVQCTVGVNDVWQTDLIEAGRRTVRSEIHKLINSIWNKEEFSEE